MGKRAPELIKVRLHDRNDDSESVWAHDLGPAKGKRGARRVQIANICFMHAKPTLRDIIVVEPDPEDADYILQWDQRGVPWSKIGTRIDQDGGRYAMIVDYTYKRDNWRGLVAAISRPGLDIEGAWGPKDGRPGRAYLAVDKATKAAQVMQWLAETDVGYTFTQIHPVPRKQAAKRAAPKSTKPRAKTKPKPKTKVKPRARAKSARTKRTTRRRR